MELKQQIIADIERLPENMIVTLSDIIRGLLLIHSQPDTIISNKPLRQPFKFGCMKGQFQISDDFNEEMDEYGRFKSEPDFGQPVKEAWD